MILKWISKEQGVRMWIELIFFKIGFTGGLLYDNIKNDLKKLLEYLE
jgi:hypothetical protein